MKASILIRWVAAVSAVVCSLSAQAAVTTQLGFAVDSSGSVGSVDFSIVRSGYASAFAALPTDGTVEVTVVRFASVATTIVAPTVVTTTSLPDIISAINAMGYTGGGTATHLAINSLTSLMTGSASFTAFGRTLNSMINIATDGEPNSQSDTLTAANNSKAAGIDAMTAEAVAAPASGVDALRDIVFSPLAGPCNNCGTVLPDGSIPPNPLSSNPWVLVVNNFADFPVAIGAKIQASVRPPEVPEPGALALVGLALAAMILTSRKRV